MNQDPLIQEFKLAVNESLDILGLPPGQLQFSDGETPMYIYPEDFEYKRKIGEGGFSVVHKFLHRPTQKFLAIKFQKIVFDPDSRQARDLNLRTYIYKMLLREIAASISANSPYIPYYYGLSFTRSTVAFCLEVLDFSAHFLYKEVYKKSTEMANRDGANRIRFDEKALGIIGASVLNALVHLKEHLEVMHRDIKPANIFIDFNGNVKLGDLGLVVLLEQSVGSSLKSGTHLYYAPEVFTNSDSRHNYSVKYDVWCLGITLLEIARFRFPYDLKRNGRPLRETQIIDSIVRGPAPILTENDGYGQETTEFVNSCVIKAPENRPHIRDLQQTSLVKDLSNLAETRAYMKEFIGRYIHIADLDGSAHDQESENSDEDDPEDRITPEDTTMPSRNPGCFGFFHILNNK